MIRPAILWNDQRSGPQTQALRKQADDRILEIGYNRANPTWTLPQMLWLRENEPEAFARVHRLYVAKDWIRARFTGGFETDLIDAIGTLMADARTGAMVARTLRHDRLAARHAAADRPAEEQGRLGHGRGRARDRARRGHARHLRDLRHGGRDLRRRHDAARDRRREARDRRDRQRALASCRAA